MLGLLTCDKPLKIIPRLGVPQCQGQFICLYLSNTEHLFCLYQVLNSDLLNWRDTGDKQCEQPSIPLRDLFLTFVLTFNKFCLRTFPGGAGRGCCFSRPLGYWGDPRWPVFVGQEPWAWTHQCQSRDPFNLGITPPKSPHLMGEETEPPRK